jgi:hypothetical protein
MKPRKRRAKVKSNELPPLGGVSTGRRTKSAPQDRLRDMCLNSECSLAIREFRRAVAEQALGNPPRNASEVNEGVLRWARKRLGLPN